MLLNTHILSVKYFKFCCSGDTHESSAGFAANFSGGAYAARAICSSPLNGSAFLMMTDTVSPGESAVF